MLKILRNVVLISFIAVSWYISIPVPATWQVVKDALLWLFGVGPWLYALHKFFDKATGHPKWRRTRGMPFIMFDEEELFYAGRQGRHRVRREDYPESDWGGPDA